MKRLILHIGVENTASTYLQETFASSRDALQNAGVLYPRAPGLTNHVKLAVLARADARRDDIWVMAGIESPEEAAAMRAGLPQELAREVTESGCDTMLLSNEHCSSRLGQDSEIRRLKDALAPIAEAMTVVIYLRRQDQAMLSTYSTTLRSGSSQPLTVPSPDFIRWKFDYRTLLERWAGVFGRQNLVVRLFDRVPDGGLLADFVTAAALPGDIVWREPETRPNTRFDARQAEYLRLLNAYFPELDANDISAGRGDLPQIVSEVERSGPPLALPPGMAEDIMQRVHAGNKAVALEYFGRELPGDPLFGELDLPIAGEPYAMDIEDFARMTAEIWKTKHRRELYLLHRLRHAQMKNSKP